MTDKSNLITTYCFKGKDYLVKMNVFNRNTLDIKVIDKITNESWHCSYDSSYIENLTQKTGNFKQFDIFVTMLKSGLLKTSESITLDLLTFDDLEALRSKRIIGGTHTGHVLPASTSNRRYFILTYTVEFDRIHYPLPLEYCGLPDPLILQGTIRRMEQEILQLQDKLKAADTHTSDEYLVKQIKVLEGRVSELTSENEQLRADVVQLNTQLLKSQSSQKRTDMLHTSLSAIEERCKRDRTHLCQQVRRLREEKALLTSQLEESKSAEKSLRAQLQSGGKKSSHSHSARQSRLDTFRKTSPSMPSERRSILKTKSPNKVLQKKNNKTTSQLSTVKNDFPLTHLNRRSSSNSSAERRRIKKSDNSPHRCHSCSSYRSSSNDSRHSTPNRLHFKTKQTKLLASDHSFSDSSESEYAGWQNKSRKIGIKKNKNIKAYQNDIRIQDLEERINNLQHLLESELPFNAENP